MEENIAENVASGEMISQWALLHGAAFVVLVVLAFAGGALVLWGLEALDKLWSHRTDVPEETDADSPHTPAGHPSA